MKQPLQVLFVDDSEADVALIFRELRREYDVVKHRRVSSEATMREALAEGGWDVILSDFVMPGFSPFMALKLMKEARLDLPFLVLSGTIEEEGAVEVLRQGAHDFIVKGRFARLVAAIERERREAKVRQEQRKLEEQLLIADRMASVGLLAAGVAHEINNPLAALLINLNSCLGHLDQLKRRVDVDVEIEQTLREGIEAAERVRNIVRDLKTFSRAEEDLKQRVDVNHVVQSSVRMATNEIRHRARLITEFGEIPAVEANESRLGQVFLNLLVNAAQSMPDGRASEHEIRVTTRTGSDGRAVIEVSDTGAGMSPEVLRNLYTPFFTTKPTGIGTGLGLSICQRIITSIGGEIEVESQVGKGSTFRISLLPSRLAAVVAPIEAPAPPVATRRGRVLVVDDDPMVCRAITRCLTAAHDVRTTLDAREGLALVAQGEIYDIIFCDLMMPEMSGMELHEQIVAVAPEQAAKMVFVTGGAFTPQARKFLSGLADRRVEKPFDPKVLMALVNARVR